MPENTPPTPTPPDNPSTLPAPLASEAPFESTPEPAPAPSSTTPTPAPPQNLFPEFLKTPLITLLAVIVPALILTTFNAAIFWIFWGEMSTGESQIALILLGTSALPAALALGFGIFAKIRHRPLELWEQLLTGLAAIGHLVAFCFLISKTIPNTAWILVSTYFLAQFIAMTPGAFFALWRVAGIPSKMSLLKDFILSICATASVPTLIYLAANGVFGPGDTHIRFHAAVLSFLLIAGTVFFFLGFLRLLSLLWNIGWRKGKDRAVVRVLFAFIVAFALPVGGLILNISVPFPADYQNLWVYGFVALTAVALVIPASGKRTVLDPFLRALRWMTFPFTLYFFVVFLPFLPFSILAILAAGTGLLMLAPVLLFALHLAILRRDLIEAKAAAPDTAPGSWERWRPHLSAAAALAVLPLSFVATIEFDRHTLHQLLDFQYARNHTADVRSPVSPWRAEHVLRNVRNFQNAEQIPYLSNWYDWRVFDNRILPEDRFTEIWTAFVDNTPPAYNAKHHKDDIFADLFGTRNASLNRRRSGRRFRPAQTTTIDNIQVTTAPAGLETEAHVTLTVSAKQENSEYQTEIYVPPGVWVSGLKLKIGDKWGDGKIIERKAAEWVYREITSVNQDPAFLRYEGDGRLKLSVFPVSSETPREVRVSFLAPTGFAKSVNIAGRVVDISGGVPVKPLLVRAGGVLAANQPVAFAPVALPRETCVIVNCSADQGWTPETLAAAFAAIAVPDAPVRTVIFANYETRTFGFSPDKDSDPGTLLAKSGIRERGGFDADNALRRAIGFYSAKLSTAPESWCAPRFVIIGKQLNFTLRPETRTVLRDTFPAVETVEAFRRETRERWQIELATGEKRTNRIAEVPPRRLHYAATPVAAGNEVQLFRANAPALSIFTSEDAVIPPRIWDANTRAFVVPPELVEMPADSRWAKGAVAWRLQRIHSQHAQDDLRRPILRASRECGVLTAAGAYIVVENSAQWKMLDLAQKQSLAANKDFEFQEAHAPDAVVLALCMALFFAGTALWRRRRRKQTSGI